MLSDADAGGPTIPEGNEPSAPITRKGILTSFKTGKQMSIPDKDVVSYRT